MQSSSSLSHTHNYFVAVDGSEASHFAYEVVTQSLMQCSDSIVVGHVYKREKTYLPFNMQPENIKQTYESLILGYGRNARIFYEELEDKSTTKEHVLSMARRANAECLVVGMHGRKGPKA